VEELREAALCGDEEQASGLETGGTKRAAQLRSGLD
jgi:hypothetical protein